MSTPRLLDARRALDMLAGPVARLRTSLEEDASVFPLNATSVLTVDAKAIDAFLQRYQQVADLLLRKLFPRVLAVIEQRGEQLRFRDMLDALERYRVIDSADEWSDIAEQRNRLVHEYAMEAPARAHELNGAWASAPLLIAGVDRCAIALEG